MAVGDIGHWRDSAGSQLSTTSWAGFNFASEQRNDNATYSKPNGSTIEIEEAGDYLFIGHIQGVDSSNGRHTPQARLNLAVGAGDFFTSYCSSYNRDSSNDEWSVLVFGLYRNAAANDQVEVQWRRDTDAPTGGSTVNESDIQVVRLGDSWNYGIYRSTSADQGYGGTTPNDLTWQTIVRETDTGAIEKQVGDTDIRLKTSGKRFLIGYTCAGDNGGNRTQRVSRAVVGSTELAASRSYFYQRSSANEFTGLGCLLLHETAAADEDLSIQVWTGDGVGANQGGADNNGSWSNNSGEETALFVIELPDSVEVFASVDGTAGQDVAGGVTTTLNAVRTVNFNDAAAFARTNDTTMTAQAAVDAMVWGNLFTARATVSSGTRWTGGARIEINGVDQTLGVHKVYTRGNQGTQDTFGGSLHPGAIFALSSSDDIEIEVFPAGNNGGDDTTVADTVGLFAINLDSLAGGGATTRTVDTSLDALAAKQDLLRTASLDALIQSQDITRTVSLDAAIQGAVLLTASVDALIRGTGLTRNVSLDALLSELGLTETVALDGLVAKEVTLTASVDAYLSATGLTGDVSLDALLQRLGVTTSLDLDALLQGVGLTRTVALDAVLVTEDGTTVLVDLDALLEAVGVTVDASLDARLRAESITVTTTVDALITGAATLAADLDALLYRNELISADVDAVLQRAVNVTTALDAVLLGTVSRTATVDLDALVRASASIATQLDGLLSRLGIEITTNLDATLLGVYSVSTAIDALVSASAAIAVQVDALLQLPGQSVAVGLDGIVVLRGVGQSFALDAPMSVPSLTAQKKTSGLTT